MSSELTVSIRLFTNNTVVCLERSFSIFFWSVCMWSSIWFCSISQKQLSEEQEAVQDIILRKENPFLAHQHGKDSESEDEGVGRLPDLEKDDFAARRARMNQPKPVVPLNQLLYGPYRKREAETADGGRQLSKGLSAKKSLESKRCALCGCLWKRENKTKQRCRVQVPMPLFPGPVIRTW